MENWIDLARSAAPQAIAAMLNGIVAAALLALLVAVLLRALPRTSASTRHAVWCAALIVAIALPFLPAAASVPSPGAAAPGSAVVLPNDARWPVYVLAAWASIAAMLLARVGWSLLFIWRLKRRAAPQAGAFERGRRIRLLASRDLDLPVAAGFFRPAILVPHSLTQRLSEDEFSQVLAHEAAHLRRRDDWTRLWQKIVEALLFFNPAVLWIGRRLDLEREIACDEWVVSTTGQARPYAACLLKLVELTRLGRAPRLAPGATARGGQTSARIEALLRLALGGSPVRSFSKPAFAGAGILLAIALAGGAAIGPLVSVAVPSLPAIAIAGPASPPIACAEARRAPPKRVRKPLAVEANAPPVRREFAYLAVREWRLEMPAARLVVITIQWRVEPRPAPANKRI